MSFSQDHALWREFLTAWPVERLRTMTLAEYSSATDRDAFAYWIEFRLKDVGSIMGGSAFKFGVFARNSEIVKDGDIKGRSYDESYGWYSKLGATSAEAFDAVRGYVVRVAEAARAGNLSEIDDVPLGDAYKWKIAFHYQSADAPTIACIFQRKPLLYALDLPLNDRQTPLSMLYRRLGERRPASESIVDFSARVWREAAQALPFEVRLPAPAAHKGVIPFSLGGAPFPASMHGTKDTPAVAARFFTDSGLAFESDVRITAAGKGVLRRNVADYFAQIGAKDGTPLVITPQPDGSYTIARKGAAPVATPVIADRPKPAPVPPSMETATPVNAPLNQILFGPPGTGKTYHTIDRALAILDPTYLLEHAGSRPALKARFDELAATGLVQFVTFHQSFSYEDFVEGLRAESENEGGALRYEVVDGVFKRVCEAARVRVVHETQAPFDVTGRRIWKLSLGDALTEPHIYRECIDNGYALLGYGAGLDYSKCTTRDDIRAVLRQAGQSAESTDFAVTAANAFVLQMKPGDLVVVTEGNLKFRALGEVTGDYRHIARLEGDTYAQCRNVRWLRVYSTALPIERLMDVRFSQATVYELRDGSINMDKLRALLKPKEPVAEVERPRVLIIDEINRGNVSRIFGELITLIEPSKRAGATESLTVTLPYSKKTFSVPDNVYLIGTMYTADRSLAGLDIALRRRFQFVEMPPRPELLDGTAIAGISVGDLLRTMNQRIEALLDRDHQLGHAYFMGLTGGEDIRPLATVFQHQIVPLLQEYFFEDWERIAWVLNDHQKPVGCRFVVEQGADRSSLFGNTVAAEMRTKLWRLDPAAFHKPASYRGIIGNHVA